jgi:hypothetical protein
VAGVGLRVVLEVLDAVVAELGIGEAVADPAIDDHPPVGPRLIQLVQDVDDHRAGLRPLGFPY